MLVSSDQGERARSSFFTTLSNINGYASRILFPRYDDCLRVYRDFHFVSDPAGVNVFV